MNIRDMVSLIKVKTSQNETTFLDPAKGPVKRKGAQPNVEGTRGKEYGLRASRYFERKGAAPKKNKPNIWSGKPKRGTQPQSEKMFEGTPKKNGATKVLGKCSGEKSGLCSKTKQRKPEGHQLQLDPSTPRPARVDASDQGDHLKAVPRRTENTATTPCSASRSVSPGDAPTRGGLNMCVHARVLLSGY